MRIGFSELLVVFFVALLVLGPDKLPGYAKKLGEALSAFRKASDEATREIRENIVEPLEEAQRPLREAMEPLEELDKAVRGNVKDVQTSLRDVGKPSARKESAPKKVDALEEPSDNMERAARSADTADMSDTADTVSAADSVETPDRTPGSPKPPAEAVQPTAPVEYADNCP